MHTRSWSLALGCSVALASLAVTGACQTPPTPYAATSTIKDLMQSVVDTNADVVWLSVSTVLSEAGTVETRPQNDEEWAKVRHGAITLAEAANLLMMPGRRVARPGEKSETPGIELEPEEMDALIAMDRAAWNARATAMRDAVLETLSAIEAKDANRVFDLGARIETTCEGCHSQYWYPSEKKSELTRISGE